MNVISNFGKHYVALAVFVLAAHLATQAQNPVESTHVDEKYAYTTVVYKNKAANDQEVLNALNNDSNFGIGDVIRITVAPPPLSATTAPVTPIAASEPVYADKSKGEDTWLATGSPATTANLVASTKSLVTEPKTVLVTSSIIAKPTPVVLGDLSVKPANTTKALAPLAMNPVNAHTPALLATAQTTAAPEAPAIKTEVKSHASALGKSAKAHKSVKKTSKKKSVFKLQLKNRKHGKQRYGCPRF